MYNLLVHNIIQNNLQDKIKPYNLGVFCFEGNGKMNGIDLDGGGGVVAKRYDEENNSGGACPPRRRNFWFGWHAGPVCPKRF